jgi:hypothetical protein
VKSVGTREDNKDGFVQLIEKRAALEAALAPGDDSGEGWERGADEASEVSSVVSGLSAYTARSAAAISAPTGSASLAPSTVGGRKPQRRVRNKACALMQLMRYTVFCMLFASQSRICANACSAVSAGRCLRRVRATASGRGAQTRRRPLLHTFQA